jgi:protein gp37
VGTTTIEWTEVTWNPVTGCSKVSPGCLNCYAERMAKRLQAMGQRNYRDGFAVRTHDHMLKLPIKWSKPRMVFVNSMGDLFHEKVPVTFIQRVFEVMDRTPHHIYQLLTKRADRLAEVAPLVPWSKNIWMGVTVEDNCHLNRVKRLRNVPSTVKFLSIEPLLGPLPDLDLEGVDWVIVGGESGPGARPMLKEWVTNIRDACIGQTVPFFFKQWGGVRKKAAGRELENRTWSQIPHHRGNPNIHVTSRHLENMIRHFNPL